MRVVTRSSLIGSRRDRTPHAAAISAATVESGRAGPHALAAVEVRGEVAVSEPEPRRQPVAVERVDGRERLAGEAPPGVGVLGAGQRVRDGVEVGADEQTVEPVVVARVDDHRDVFGGTTCTSPRRNRAAPTPPASAASTLANVVVSARETVPRAGDRFDGGTVRAGQAARLDELLGPGDAGFGGLLHLGGNGLELLDDRLDPLAQVAHERLDPADDVAGPRPP